MRVAIYARTSTQDQDCGIQRRELLTEAQRRGWTVTHEYMDAGVSGAQRSRPRLDELLAAAKRREFDAVLVWKIDRFGRSVLHFTENLRLLDAAGVRFIATSQGIDTDQANPTSRLLTHILAAVAEFERDLIRERTTAGMRHAKANGVQVGRRHRVFDRERARELRDAGRSWQEIARELGVPASTIRGGL